MRHCTAVVRVLGRLVAVTLFGSACGDAGAEGSAPSAAAPAVAPPPQQRMPPGAAQDEPPAPMTPGDRPSEPKVAGGEEADAPRRPDESQDKRADGKFDDGGGLLPAGIPGWRSFGYDPGNTRHSRDERKISRDNVAKLEPLWMLELPGGTNGTPAIADGTLYYGGVDNQLHALEASSGKVLWSVPVAEQELRSSPLIDDASVYFAAGSRVSAFARADGKQLWSTRVEPHANAWVLSSPARAGELVIVGTCATEGGIRKSDYTFAGRIVALDRSRGELAWERMVAGRSLDAGDGTPVWSSAAVDETTGVLFIGTGQAYEAPPSELSDALLAIDSRTGQVLWSHQFTTNDVFTLAAAVSAPAGYMPLNFDIGASPNLFDIAGRPAVGVGSKSGVYKAFDRETGAVLWETMLTAGSSEGGIMASAAVGDDRIFVTSNDWRVRSFTRGDGSHSPQDTGQTFALDAATGAKVWQAEVPAPAAGFLTLANGVVYQGLMNGAAIALDAESGDILWQYDMGHDLALGFSVIEGVVYGGSGGRWIQPSRRPGGSLAAFAVTDE